jgi:hypothetical protein
VIPVRTPSKKRNSMRKTISITDYREKVKYTDMRTQQGPFLITPLFWFRLLENRDDATILSFLWNQRNIYEHLETLGEGGWFWCVSKDFEKYVLIPRRTLFRILKRLKKMGFISVQLRLPHNANGSARNVRWIRVNKRKIKRAVIKRFGKEFNFEKEMQILTS